MTAQEAFHPPGKYRLRVADYLTLAKAGAFEGLRTELIEGDIIVMSPQFRPHGMVKLELYDRLRDALKAIGSALRPVVEVSLALDDYSLPDPDLLLTNEPFGDGPVPLGSVALVIEVADTTRARDLGAKVALYARNGIAEYWVADVQSQVIHQFWALEGDRYAERREIAFHAPIVAATISDLTLEPLAG